MNTIQNKIRALRAEMRKLNIDAWYISGTDPHSSEYLPAYWQTRSFISGFTGSYGMVVITQKEAGLWTDTRYFIQADEQLKGTGISMNKLRVANAVSPEVWLTERLEAGNHVGIDAQTISVTGFKNLKKILFENEIELVETPDLFETIWDNRPLISSNKIFELEPQFAGVSRLEKQAKIVESLKKTGADY